MAKDSMDQKEMGLDEKRHVYLKENIDYIKECSGWTYEEVAEVFGCSRKTLYDLLKDDHSVLTNRFLSVAKILNIDPYFLMYQDLRASGIEFVIEIVKTGGRSQETIKYKPLYKEAITRIIDNLDAQISPRSKFAEEIQEKDLLIDSLKKQIQELTTINQYQKRTYDKDIERLNTKIIRLQDKNMLMKKEIDSLKKNRKSWEKRNAESVKKQIDKITSEEK